MPSAAAIAVIGATQPKPFHPLDTLTIIATAAGTLLVCDGAGRVYHREPFSGSAQVTLGGALGTHRFSILNAAGQTVTETTVTVDAQTALQENTGTFATLFDRCFQSMCCYAPSGSQPIVWRGKEYRAFVGWILDHNHTAKGMQYFNPDTNGLVDLLSEAQREDGLIWSFARSDTGPGWFDTVYGNDGYTKRDGGILFARQPSENHPEYNFVEAMHTAWKSSGNTVWMKMRIDAAIKALNYVEGTKGRWSKRFDLPIRGYTIDSWDFQILDEYTVHFDLATPMRIDPDRTKFGVFFGDAQGYALACEKLAEMLRAADRLAEAASFSERAKRVHQKLNAIAWNGRFYTHRVEEDPAVVRDVGVDEKSQISMSNAYALNRGVSAEQAQAILHTYDELRHNLPPRSPGEFYAIYPPFGRGFGDHGDRWQYMNGGVHAHAAGELARGAFVHGWEFYGANILTRIGTLVESTDKVVHFAYTGAYEDAPPEQTFTPLDISPLANMSLATTNLSNAIPWMGGTKPGNDMKNLPTGHVTFAGVPYTVSTAQKAAVAIGASSPMPRDAAIPINAQAGAVYLLHACGNVGPTGAAAALTFTYDDGTSHTVYLRTRVHIATGWWFPEIKAKTADGAGVHKLELDADETGDACIGKPTGVAWRGPNGVSTDVGVSFAAIANPYPDKKIAALHFAAAADGAIYALLGVTLASAMPYQPPSLISFGGPDNWSGALLMAAIIEGLAGVADAPDTTAFSSPIFSPRWSATEASSASVTVRYAASSGYITYRWTHAPERKQLLLHLSCSADAIALRVLLPANAGAITRFAINGNVAEFAIEHVGQSRYLRATTPVLGSVVIDVNYIDRAS